MLPLFNASGSLIDAIRINSITNEVREGRAVWVKRRRMGSRQLIRAANLFFRLAQNPISVFGKPDLWQRWEIDCFQLLNGDRYQAFPGGPSEVCAEKLPGDSLCRLLDRGELTPDMLIAAGRELQRAHSLRSEAFDGPWSHGDAHLGNFVFDRPSERCRLIDFEVMHHPSLTPDERHADDLLVPLLDLLGRVRVQDWVPLALAFLDAYNRPEIVAALRRRLIVPQGIPRLWWAIRCDYMGTNELRKRLFALNEALA